MMKAELVEEQDVYLAAVVSVAGSMSSSGRVSVYNRSYSNTSGGVDEVCGVARTSVAA
jgi:hypothetical protein